MDSEPTLPQDVKDNSWLGISEAGLLSQCQNDHHMNSEHKIMRHTSNPHASPLLQHQQGGEIQNAELIYDHCCLAASKPLVKRKWKPDFKTRLHGTCLSSLQKKWKDWELKASFAYTGCLRPATCWSIAKTKKQKKKNHRNKNKLNNGSVYFYQFLTLHCNLSMLSWIRDFFYYFSNDELILYHSQCACGNGGTPC